MRHVSGYAEVSEWSEVGVGWRQGCVMSPWLFNLFMDWVMREVREKVDDVGPYFRTVRSTFAYEGGICKLLYHP